MGVWFRLEIVTGTPRISPDYYNFEQQRWTFTAVSRSNWAYGIPPFTARVNMFTRPMLERD